MTAKADSGHRVRRSRLSWREPLLHFFLLGFIVFGLYGLFERKEPAGADSTVVEVTAADIEWFRTLWRKRMGREPTVEELRGQVHQRVREEILSREAVSLGLDEGDTPEPSEAELRDFLELNRATYEMPGETAFRHVYFNSDARGPEEAAAAARGLAERLNRERPVSLDLAPLGDAFLLPLTYSNETFVGIRGDFGDPFAETVWALEPHTWHGPVRSGYGVHAVFVHERVEATSPAFSELRERLREDWLALRERELAETVYREIRGRYRVLVEGMPYQADARE
jgi:hypothetical protein